MTEAEGKIDFLAGGGEMGARMRAHDWRATPLGSPETWPQSLRTSVSICLNCAFPILIWWGPQLVKFYNDAYAPILGSKHPRALGSPGHDVWPEIWDVIGPMLGRVLERGEPTRADDLRLMLHRGGYAEECYFRFSYSPIRDETAVGGVFCPVTETTDRVLSERRLHVLSRLAEGTTNIHSRAQVFSAAAACLAEHGALDLPFVGFYQAGEQETGAIRLVATAGLAGGSAFPEAITTDAAGHPCWPFIVGDASAVLHRLSDQQAAALPRGPWDRAPEHLLIVPLNRGLSIPLGYMVAGVNPHRPAEEIQSFAELVAQQIGSAIANARAYEQERARAEALAEIDRAKTTFFSNISHEFRTPLTLLLGPLEDALADPALPPVHAEAISLAHRNALRLLRLVNGLLDFSRIEAGRVEASYEPVELAGYTGELASTFRSACERAGLTLDVDCPPLPHPVYVDRGFWEKIVLNLVSNAFKFTLAGRISVRVMQDGETALLTVTDTGVGIPQAELPRLFERFHRVEGVTGRSIEGSGIGLALVHDLVRLQGGEVRVESEVGKGSSFQVCIPLGTAHLPSHRVGSSSVVPGTATQAQAFVHEAMRWQHHGIAVPFHDDVFPDNQRFAMAPVSSATSGDSGRVLLADDNADLRDYVRRLLESRGYAVEAVADGQAALDAARVRRPDLILTDVMMPQLNGFELLAAVRADPGLAELPVLMLSARAGEEARIEGLEAGADDYLVKPFSARELLARVAANLEIARTRSEAAQRVRESAEQQRLSEERLRIALEGAEIGVWDLDLETQQGIWTERLFEFLGLAIPPDLKGSYRLWRNRLHPDDAERTLAAFTQATVAGERFRAEYRIIRADTGEIRWLAGFGRVFPSVTGGRRTVGVVMDITERKEAEAVLARDKADLARLVAERTRDLEATHATMAHLQRMEALGQLAGGIAHDFNNVLQSVQGGAQLIDARASEPDKVRRLAKMIGNAAVRGSGITRRLLTFARRADLRAEPVDVVDLLSEVREILAHTLGSGIEIRVQIGPDLPLLLADRTQLETVLINLAANARDAMAGAGILTLSAASESVSIAGTDLPRALKPGRYVCLFVSDTGSGMTPEILARAWEPFFTTKPSGKGTGLGLAMARGFAEQSGGALVIESAVGHGTTIRLWFPVAAPGAPNVLAEPRHETRSGQGRISIMLVDDEPLVRAIMAEQLEEAGFALLSLGSAAEALALLDRGEVVDALITDLSMPGMDGIALIREARSRRPSLVAILLTGFATDAAEIAIGGALSSSFSLLRKPVEGSALAERVAALLCSKEARLAQ